MGCNPGPLTVVASALVVLTIPGCEREPLEAPCAAVTGDLVITEIRGPQEGEDGYGEWLEVYNATSTTVDLTGLRVQITYLDGAEGPEFVIRGGTNTVEAGGYFVMGRADNEDVPGHMDYGYRDELDSSLPNTAAIDLESCGELVDRLVYRNLPNVGTYSLSGEATPDHMLNDDDRTWCTDDVADENTPSFGIRGTPGEMNRSCN